MSLIRKLSRTVLLAGGLLLTASAAYAAGVPLPKPQPSPLPAPIPKPTPAPLPAPAPGGGGGGTVVNPGGGGGVALPELKWFELEEGLAKGKSEKKPVIVVFTTRSFKGAGTFESNQLRESLTKSAAVPVRVLPPDEPAANAKLTDEERKLQAQKYQEALKKYRELAQQYGASDNPSMFFLTPDGDRVFALARPDFRQVNQYLLELPKAVKDLEEKKAPAGK